MVSPVPSFRALRWWLALAAAFAFLPGAASFAAAASSAERCLAEAAQARTAACEEAIAEDPQDLRSWNNLAQAYLLMGDDNRALKTFRDITILRPEDPEAHFNYGATAGTLRRYEIAVGAFRRALALRPDYVEAELVLSIALEKLGRIDEAVAAKRHAAELGDDIAMYELTEDYAAGIAPEVSESEVRAWIERAADLGHVGAMDWMVRVYGEGLLGEARDPAKADAWRVRAHDARESCC